MFSYFSSCRQTVGVGKLEAYPTWRKLPACDTWRKLPACDCSLAMASLCNFVRTCLGDTVITVRSARGEQVNCRPFNAHLPAGPACITCPSSYFPRARLFAALASSSVLGISDCQSTSISIPKLTCVLWSSAFERNSLVISCNLFSITSGSASDSN